MNLPASIDFVQFKQFIVGSARSRVLAFINASCLGMQWTPEYFDLETLWVPDGYRLFMLPTHELIPIPIQPDAERSDTT